MRVGEGVYLKKTFNIALLKSLARLAENTTMIGMMRNYLIASAAGSCSMVFDGRNKI